MRRFMVLVTVLVLMAAMMVIATPASADAGCQEFGLLAAFEAQLETGIGQEVSAAAPADDDVNLLKAAAGC